MTISSLRKTGARTQGGELVKSPSQEEKQAPEPIKKALNPVKVAHPGPVKTVAHPPAKTAAAAHPPSIPQPVATPPPAVVANPPTVAAPPPAATPAPQPQDSTPEPEQPCRFSFIVDH